MPRRKPNGTPPTPSERQRIEDGIRQLHARLQDITARERYANELAEFLKKRRLLTRYDVTRVATEVLPSRKVVRGTAGLAALSQAQENGDEGGTTKRKNATTKATKSRLGAAIRKWRAETETGTAELAEKLGVHVATLNGWERGAFFPANEEKRAAILKITKLPESIFT
jgi:DNA-binding transcriptional regulator YiaG